jgi:hypothetical protein
VYFTPTVSHCSMATLIGLCIRVQLLRALPRRFKVDLFVSPGSHASEHAGTPSLCDQGGACMRRVNCAAQTVLTVWAWGVAWLPHPQ